MVRMIQHRKERIKNMISRRTMLQRKLNYLYMTKDITTKAVEDTTAVKVLTNNESRTKL